MSDHVPQILIVEPRRPGRPRSSDPMVPIMTRIPSEQYDRLLKMASKREGETASSIVRQILMAQSFLK